MNGKKIITAAPMHFVVCFIAVKMVESVATKKDVVACGVSQYVKPGRAFQNVIAVAAVQKVRRLELA